jgi:hypothetical protein
MENLNLTQIPTPSVRTRAGMPVRGYDSAFGASWMTPVVDSVRVDLPVICDTQAVATKGHVAFVLATVPGPTAWSPPIL